MSYRESTRTARRDRVETFGLIDIPARFGRWDLELARC
jgi:hypothetical protein